MRLFDRKAPNCAALFNALVWVCLAELICTLVAAFSFPWFFLVMLPVTVAYAGVLGLVAYQIGYHPALVALMIAALFLPYASLVLFLILFLQAKRHLKKQNYRIVWWGARPARNA